MSKDSTYDSELIDIIENHIIAILPSYCNQDNYFMFANQVIGECKKKISQNSMDQYCNAIMRVISIDTSAVVNAFRSVSTLVSGNVWCKNVSTLLNYVSEEIYSVVYDIVNERMELFNEENDNLKELVDFLVDFIELSEKPDDVINVINGKFSAIGNLDILISKLMNIQYDEENASIKLAKFVDSNSMDDITKIIVEECNQDEVRDKKITKIFSKSEKYSGAELIFRVNENKESMNKNNILCMLKFCRGFISESNIESCLEIITYLIENYLEKDVFLEILLLISDFSDQIISKARAGVCGILVEIFRKSSSDDVRRKCSMLIKDKRLSRKVRGIFNEDEMKEYKAHLS